MRKIALALAACCAAAPLLAQAAAPPPATADTQAKAPFVKADADAVVRKLATALEADFVFPDKGKAYAQMLRSKLGAGGYSSFADADAFAEALTADLQAVHEDRHLRVRRQKPELPGAVAASRPQRRGPPATLNAISKSGWLADGVAYIRFEGFPGTEATMAALRSFLESHADAKTLVIDARSHRGGGLKEMDLMFPALFEKPTLLVGMDTRLSVDQKRRSPFQGQESLRKVAGPDGVVRREHWVTPAASSLSKAKLFLLTSSRTVSAGEHLSLSLKRTGRATLVGETTRGAGHYGGVVALGHGYSAFIPVGRTFDPDNNQGWEGVGVKPDVEVPADKALDEALKLAGVDPAAASAKLASLK